MKKFISILLILSLLPLSVFAKFENTHINTGDTLEDIIAIAGTQLGYMEGDLTGEVQKHNDVTKYGEWYGINPGAWCAMFVSWCADQAGIPTTVIPKHASCDVGMQWFINKGRFSYAPAYGGTYTPKRGDIVYFGTTYNEGFDSTHVGIVYKVDDTKIYVLEGNSSDKAQEVPYKQTSSYILGYGKPDYSLKTSELKPGRYVTTASSLNHRAEPTTSSESIGKIPYGTVVDITEIANEKWGKTTYNGKSGWVSLDYCVEGFAVIYNANGGTSAPENQIKLPDETVYIPNVIPTRQGYGFIGWSSSADGEAEYFPGGSYSANESITLYAVWDANSYTVSYSANGGSGAPGSQVKKHDTAITLSDTVPQRNGYIFLGWASSPAGEVKYQPGDEYTENKTAILYAVWKLDKKTFTVSYDANGGKNPPSAESFTEGTSIKISDTVPVREGYCFEGWAYAKDEEWPSLFGGDVYDTNASVTLYALWSRAINGLEITVGPGGRVVKSTSGSTVTLKITADSGNAISYISVGSVPVGLVGDCTEYILTLFDSADHKVVCEFTGNDGLWINPFEDVSSKGWYIKAIEYCFANNIMTGMDATHFAPNAPVTRAQFVTLIGRLHGNTEGNVNLPFTDVSEKGYYYKYLCWAYENKLVSGVSATEFAPNAAITREQLCVMLYNYALYSGMDTEGVNPLLLEDFADAASVSSWAHTAMSWAVYYKHISGIAGSLAPRATATRAQAAQIIYKAFSK